MCAMCGAEEELINWGDNHGAVCIWCREMILQAEEEHLMNEDVEPESEQDPLDDSSDPEPEPTKSSDSELEPNGEQRDAKRRRLG